MGAMVHAIPFHLLNWWINQTKLFTHPVITAGVINIVFITSLERTFKTRLAVKDKESYIKCSGHYIYMNCFKSLNSVKLNYLFHWKFLDSLTKSFFNIWKFCLLFYWNFQPLEGRFSWECCVRWINVTFHICVTSHMLAKTNEREIFEVSLRVILNKVG